ncbi:MAG: type VI secretion system protein TssA [Verrucomicrobiota bacterium]
MINVDDLLKPIADDKPCGEDFTYHASFQNLETISRGKAETQFSPPQEPDWKEVRDVALEVLGQSKHLTAGVILTLSLLKIGGLEGLRDGLAVVRGITEKYWSTLFPKLDPDDKNDPTERLNILNNLSSAGEPYRFAVHLKQVVLCHSPAMGRITLEQILTAKEKVDKTQPSGGTGSGQSGPDLNQIQAAFRDAGPDAAKAALGLVDQLIGHTRGIETFLDSALGAGRGVNFESLSKLLGEMKHAVQPYAVSEAVAQPSADGGGGGPSVAKPAPVSGTIQTRADVIKALGLICDYYRDNEPSSPVPLILQRAQRLVDKDFMTIMTDLTPDALKQLHLITGTKPEK